MNPPLLLPRPIPDLDGHLPPMAVPFTAPDRAFPPSGPVLPYTPAQHTRSNRSSPVMILASPWPRQHCPPVVKRNVPLRPSNSSTHPQSTMPTVSITILPHARPLHLPRRGRNHRAGSQSGGRDLPHHVPPFPVRITYPTPRRWQMSIL